MYILSPEVFFPGTFTTLSVTSAISFYTGDPYGKELETFLLFQLMITYDKACPCFININLIKTPANYYLYHDCFWFWFCFK